MKRRIPARATLFVIRVLTVLYPSRFRRMFADEIVQDFIASYGNATRPASHHRSAHIRLIVRAVCNIISSAVSERINSSLPRRRKSRRKTSRKDGEIMHGTWQDLRFAVRALRNQPFFTSVVVLTLALGIGANTAIFSLVSRVLWTDLPYAEPDELVSVWTSNLTRGVNRWGVSLHDYTDWRTRNDVFAEVAAFNVNTVNLSGLDRPQRVTYAQVTPSFFTTLQTPSQLGRIFREEENLPGRDDVVILSDGFWRDVLGGAQNVVGTRLIVDGRSMTIVGVMPPAFAFPSPSVQLWKPFGMLPGDEGDRGGRWVRGIGRLKPNMPLQTAQASLDVLGASLAAEYPETNDGFGIYVEPLLATTVSGVQASLLILWGTTGVILLIVCANVANMVLARTMARSREMAVRSALGASRSRLARQSIVEGLPLAAFGGILGVGVAALSVRFLPLLVAGQVPRLGEVTLDGRILAYSVAVSLVVGVIFSLVPVLRSSTNELSDSLRDGTRSSHGASTVRLRNGIVVVQIALATTVVIGAGLMAKSLTALLRTDPGFSGDNVLTVRIAPSWSEMPERSAASQLFDELQAAVAELPNVVHVSAINSLPLTGNSWGTGVEIVGRTSVDQTDRPPAFTRVVLPGYHETMGVPLLRGRLLNDRDIAGAVNAVVINETAARTWWPDEDPIGKAIRFDGPDPRTVVGVVGDVSMSGPGTPATSMLYVPFAQARFGTFQNWGMTFVVRTNNDVRLAAPTIVQRMSSIAGDIPLYSVRSMDDVLGASVSSQRIYTRLLGVFASIALTLATIGVYSVISYLVNQCTKEIGVRIALGAARAIVVRSILRRALLVAAAGITFGALAATLLSRTLAGFLYQTSPVDPTVYCLVAGTFGFAAIVASIEPALRATRVDPVRALRCE